MAKRATKDAHGAGGTTTGTAGGTTTGAIDAAAARAVATHGTGAESGTGLPPAPAPWAAPTATPIPRPGIGGLFARAAGSLVRFGRTGRFTPATARAAVDNKPQAAAPPVISGEFPTSPTAAAAPTKTRSLGTFGGVFTPSFLTIIGVIMYLRFSWVLANAGLIQTIAIVVIANTITFITALSVAGIASNERMETGGAYFMVSRVLGYEAGGSIGVPLFFSQALSVSLYVFGFAEAVTVLMPQWSVTVVALITVLALAVVGLVGTRLMILIQYVILAALVASFVSIAAGFNPAFLGQNIEAAYAAGLGFWPVFAVFFPAVTGLLAGVSMSGDLKDPAKSIPRGTLAAVGSGFVIYLLVPVLLAFSVARADLAVSSALRDAARWPVLVTIGVVGATLSSAIGSLMGAPRTLQALAIDRIAPRFFCHGVGKAAEPLRASLLTVAMALVTIVLGNLNQIAEVLTMFFLTTYGVLNLAAGLEQLVGNPSYRPSIRVPAWVSFLGALGCIAVMFLINVVATSVALTAVMAVFLGLSVRSARLRAAGDLTVNPGGLWEGFWTSALFRVAERLERSRSSSGKNWRPLVQVFAADIEAHAELITTAAMLTNRGGATAVYAIVDQPAQSGEVVATLRSQFADFAAQVVGGSIDLQTVITDSFHEAVVVSAQAAAFAAGHYNTVMLGLPTSAGGDREFTRMLTRLVAIDRNIIIFKKGDRAWTSIYGPIVVWWGGKENNVRLMMILAYLAQSERVAAIQSAFSIELKTVVTDESQVAAATAHLHESLSQLRLTAQTSVVVNAGGRPMLETIAAQSRHAALVVLGMAKPDGAAAKDYLARLRAGAAAMDSVMFVLNNIPGIDYT